MTLEELETENAFLMEKVNEYQCTTIGPCAIDRGSVALIPKVGAGFDAGTAYFHANTADSVWTTLAHLFGVNCPYDAVLLVCFHSLHAGLVVQLF